MYCLQRGNFISEVVIAEHDDVVTLNGESSVRIMTPAQARHLARKLHRLARRIERRQQEHA